MYKNVCLWMIGLRGWDEAEMRKISSNNNNDDDEMMKKYRSFTVKYKSLIYIRFRFPGSSNLETLKIHIFDFVVVVIDSNRMCLVFFEWLINQLTIMALHRVLSSSPSELLSSQFGQNPVWGCSVCFGSPGMRWSPVERVWDSRGDLSGEIRSCHSASTPARRVGRRGFAIHSPVLPGNPRHGIGDPPGHKIL